MPKIVGCYCVLRLNNTLKLVERERYQTKNERNFRNSELQTSNFLDDIFYNLFKFIKNMNNIE